MAGRSGLILPPGMGVVEGNPNAGPLRNPDELITRRDAEVLAVEIAEHYFRQTQKVVTDTLLQLGLIQEKHLSPTSESPTSEPGSEPGSETASDEGGA